MPWNRKYIFLEKKCCPMLTNNLNLHKFFIITESGSLSYWIQHTKLYKCGEFHALIIFWKLLQFYSCTILPLPGGVVIRIRHFELKYHDFTQENAFENAKLRPFCFSRYIFLFNRVHRSDAVCHLKFTYSACVMRHSNIYDNIIKTHVRAWLLWDWSSRGQLALCNPRGR